MNVFIVRSLANDLNTEQGIVRYRVVLLLRLSEIKPLFYRSVQFFLFFIFMNNITSDIQSTMEYAKSSSTGWIGGAGTRTERLDWCCFVLFLRGR